MSRLYSMTRPSASRATLDPVLALGNGILTRAIKDLKNDDPLVALDALDWLITDSEFYLDILGYAIDPNEAFVKAVKYAAS